MFRKLRNRFLVLNLLIISVMMIAAFSAIYLITYRNIHTDTQNELRRVSEFYLKPNQMPFRSKSEPYPEEDGTMSADRSVSFALLTDNNWNILATASVFDMDDVFYQTARNEAVSDNKETGEFKLDGTYWGYIVRSEGNRYMIAFIDISSERTILTRLIYTFLITAAVMLVMIYLISRFFADRAIKPVSEAFSKQRQFIADASHEIKTPLAIIGTSVDLVMTNKADSVESQSKWLGYIKAEAAKMNRLTSDLLYLARLDHAETQKLYADFDISGETENVILSMEGIAYEKSVSLDYDIEPALSVFGCREQIAEVITALLDNAIKFAGENGWTSVCMIKRHNNVLLTVSNSGNEINKEHMDRIFDRFYRADKSRSGRSGGYGLGLSIVKTIIEQHKGKISVKSSREEGTTFHVELPSV